MLAFVEAFWIMGVVFLLMLPFLPLLQYAKKKRVPQPAPKLQRFPANSVHQQQVEPKAVGDEVLEEEPHLVMH